MAKLTPAEQAKKWQDRTKAATSAYRTGIDKVSESPMEKAANSEDKMLAGIQNAVSSGKWAKRLRSVSLAQWKEAAINKGVGRIAAGVDSAVPTMEKFVGQLNTHQDNIKSELASMPNLTLDDNIQRMVHNARRMSEFEFDK